MGIDNLKQIIPDYAKDLKLNLGSLASEETLTEQQLWGCFAACALAGRNNVVIREVLAEAAEHLSEDALNAAKSAASIMAMNNVYYRFAHLATSKDYLSMPAKLRMNVIGNPGVDKGDFELWSLAVSVINGCGMCIDAHEKQLLDHGMSRNEIQAAARIGAVVQAVSATLDGEFATQDSKELSQAA
jgi:alkyl hydroperoxide reductase subunit D